MPGHKIVGLPLDDFRGPHIASCVIQKNFLLPDDIASLIPAKGQKEFIIRAIKMAAGVGGVSPPPPAKSEGKPVFVRDGRRYLPAFKYGEMETVNGQKRHSGPCTEAPHVKAWQGGVWFAYTELWKWPDPFPGLVEWYSMGCPEKPLEDHRLPLERRGGVVPAASDEPEAVESEAQAVPPPTVQLATGAQCATLPDDI